MIAGFFKVYNYFSMTATRILNTFVFSLCLIFAVSGCSNAVKKKPDPYEAYHPQTLEDQAEMDKSDLRMMAAVNLTRQGKTLLSQGKFDDAISVFERAININAEDGRNYYYLSEAWLKKGNLALAEEFNHLASIYSRQDFTLKRLVKNQQDDIEAIKNRN